MKNILLTLLSVGILALGQDTYSQDQKKKPQTIRDLDFLIGTWDITFNFYNPQKPEIGLWFTEKGTVTCSYGMLYNGKPQYIICSGKVVCDSGRFKGRQREFMEYIRYGGFVKGFERIGLYSNWPGTARELLFFHPLKRAFEIKGELTVKNGIERYEDVYSFNEDYTSYSRTNLANFPDMPITQFNLTIEGVGKKRKD